jgi:hypothetical protein
MAQIMIAGSSGRFPAGSARDHGTAWFAAAAGPASAGSM